MQRMQPSSSWSSRASEASVWIGIIAVLAIIGLTVWEAAVEH